MRYLLLRTFQLPTTTASHVKLVVVSNQCTGSSDFHGEQDQDPANATDCRTTAIANQVRVAELQLLSGWWRARPGSPDGSRANSHTTGLRAGGAAPLRPLW